MPFAGQVPLITVMIAGVFVLVMLSQGYVTQVRDWIHAKVAE